MSTKAKKDEVDVSRFEGNGLSFKAKLIGIENVPEARGDQMCQDALLKLKNDVRVSGEHKQKVFVNVTLEGLKIVDAISLAGNQNKKKDPKAVKSGEENSESSQETNGSVLHSHAVHRISFISRDTTDSRAFGYIYGESDDTHKFYAIKTAAAAEQLVYTIRDLFQAVYDMKKKEMEDAKQKLEQGDITANTTSVEGNSQSPGNGSTSGTGQTPQTSQNAEGENIYQVPPNNAPVQPQAEQAANLLDLEDQTEHILKGIEQIKNLEFDSITDDPKSPTSPVSPTSPLVSMGTTGAPGFADPWGMPAASTAAAAAPTSTSSALGDLAGLQTSTFPTMPGGMQTFPGTPFPAQGGFGTAPGFGPPGALPISKDPFGNDPFSMNAQQRPAVPPVGGFPASNPFGGGGFPPQQAGAFPPQQMYGAPPRGMMPGAPGVAGAAGAPGFMGQPGFGQPASVNMAPNPFGMGFPQTPAAPQQQGNLFGEPKEESNLLQPMRKDDGSAPKEGAFDKAPKKMRDDLFGDLVNIKKTPGSSGDSPKDLFAKANMVEKKSMNALKAQVGNDFFDSEPFGSSHSLEDDKTRGLLPSQSEDPFDTSHIPPTLSEPPKSSPPAQPISVADITPPPVPKRPVTSVAKEGNKNTIPTPVLLPPHPSSRKSKLSTSSHSSSSSLSSTSSSTSPSLSAKSQHQAPSTKAPPPLPKRTPADGASPSKTCDISDVNTPPVNLALSIKPSAHISDMLPSPDEPPPPLPNISFAASAPPPPPRPSSNFPVSTQSSTKGVLEDEPPKSALSSQDIKKDFEVKFDDDFLSASSKNMDNADSDTNIAKPDLRRDSDKTSALQTDIGNPSTKEMSKDLSDPFSPSHSLLKTKSRPRAVPKPLSAGSGKKGSDPFFIPPPSGKTKAAAPKTNELSTAASVDPFSMPVHLTPGFKAEAKFGNDPFEDSFTEVLSGNQAESTWDPFSPDPNANEWVNSKSSKSSVATTPTDPSGAPAQPVNGNTDQGSLFD